MRMQRDTPWPHADAILRKERAFLTALGRQVRGLRRARGLTQAELAEHAGIGMKYVGKIERGRTNPTMSLMWRLSGALDVDPSELFLFTSTDGDHGGLLRVQLLRFLQARQEKDLERIAQILKLIVE
jgi:transcriptional regulator with XRE-family HTH domain